MMVTLFLFYLSLITGIPSSIASVLALVWGRAWAVRECRGGLVPLVGLVAWTIPAGVCLASAMMSASYVATVVTLLAIQTGEWIYGCADLATAQLSAETWLVGRSAPGLDRYVGKPTWPEGRED